jgi:hypothetical protein
MREGYRSKVTTMQKHQMEVISFLRKSGATKIQLVNGRKHGKLYYLYQGRKCVQVIPSSPSDHRYLNNFKRDFRRAALQGKPIKAEGQ